MSYTAGPKTSSFLPFLIFDIIMIERHVLCVGYAICMILRGVVRHCRCHYRRCHYRRCTSTTVIIC